MHVDYIVPVYHFYLHMSMHIFNEVDEFNEFSNTF